MNRARLQTFISYIVTSCCVFVYVVVACCALALLVWRETHSAMVLKIGAWLALADFLALLGALGCLVGLVILHDHFAVRQDARRIALALGLGLGLSALGMAWFNWESGRSVLRIINDAATPVNGIRLADNHQRVPCGSVGPRDSVECVLHTQEETDLRVSLEVNGLTGEWVYCGYWMASISGPVTLRMQPSGGLRIEKRC